MAPINETKRKVGPSSGSNERPAKISKIREEDAPFPRGGASLLTPLEHKQIQIEATRDALFEQQGAKSKKSNANDDDGQTERKQKKSKSKKKGKGGTEATEPEEETVKIEGLSYKRIVPGSLVLGQVSQINAHDIALTLPNNLTGYVPITAISDKITERIEAIAEAEDSDADNNEEDSDDVDLEKLFTIGQYLRACVVSTSDDDTSSGKAKRRIELSLRPQQSNNDITNQNIVPNTTLMASVRSVEDHGVIMDLGITGSDVKGFMSSNEIGHGLEMSSIQEGAIFFCLVMGQSSNGKIIKLSADTQKIGNLKKSGYLSEAPTVEAFLPGTAVEVLVADVTPKGVIGKVMGMVDVTADLIHSGAAVSSKDIEKKYKIGSKTKGRVICTFPNAEPPKLGISLLDHVVSFSPQLSTKDGKRGNPVETLPLSAIIESVTVQKVEPGIGLFVDVGVKGVSGFVHISRVKDGKIESLSESTGPYKVNSTHRGRVIGYNSVDGMYLISLEPSVLEQPFLRIEDLKIAEVVKGKVEKIVVNAAGVGGVLVNLADGITGLVPEAHMADVQLLHPEKKFREGMTVTVRVLSTDPSRRQIRLTLKKSLVNSEATPFTTYGEISTGMQSPGTIVNILPTGAVVQFYGTVRGFLPVYEMSEAYIQDPSQHFRIGQVVNVHVLKVDHDANKLVVSCKDPSIFGLAQQAALKKLGVGEVVSATVTEKSSDDINVEIQDLGLKAVLSLGHLTDGSETKNLSAMKKIRVGQVLTDLVVLEKVEQRHLIILTNKPSLVKAAKNRTLLRSFEDVKENKFVQGFVKNITLRDVFVQFAGGVTGLLPKTRLPAEIRSLPDFGMRKYQPVEVKIVSVDRDQQRFVLSMTDAGNDSKVSQESSEESHQAALNPVDSSINSLGDIAIGKLIKAKVSSVKDTQINVQLADNIQGRIDISQVFDSWDDIKNRKQPLKQISKNSIIPVRVLGIHDARNHRFLPITHRAGKTLVFELSAKPSDQEEVAKEPITLDDVKVGSSWVAFVNNISPDCVWVNLTPNVRGRIRHLDLSDDVSLLTDIDSNFPVGSAIRVHVTSVDAKNNRLDLSARSAQTSEALTFKNLSKGMVVPGKVTRVNERHIMVQLSESISGPVYLSDLADDFDEADPTKYSKNDIIRVCITDIDAPNKRIRLSTRPSRVLNSSLPVQDPEISSISQVKVNDVLRGFVKDVSDKGLFINLGNDLKAYVRVSDLSDSFLKDWKSNFEVDQLVKGKVVAVDENLNHIQMSLKASVLDKNYVPPLTFNDVKVGQIVTGKIRKVEDFGVFIVVDNSANVSGLCHQSEMAEKRVHNVKKVYDEGDAVKAIILKIDPETKRINFGLKASYFEDGAQSADESEDDDDLSGMQGVKLTESDDEEDEEEDEDEHGDEESGVELDDEESAEEKEDSDEEMEDVDDKEVAALNAGGFDWSADVLDKDVESHAESDDDGEDEKPKKKRRKAEIKVDRTGDLDANGPQSVSDFERLLLGQPDSSQLWIAYMAFQVQLSELGKAREVAERAIKAINIREETEKFNVWSAWLNLEAEYGTSDSLDDVFKRACQYNDAQEVHETLISIYIQSEKHDKADELFQILVKKFSQSPAVWYNYADFLHRTHSSPDRARALLPRAVQSLPPHTHLALTLKFASLEFKSANGSPERGRTIFEGLVATYPKRLDIWNQLLDLEINQGDKEIVRGVFERVVKIKGLKPKGAKAWFKRWSVWEAENGDDKSREKVKAKAEEWVRAAAQKDEEE